MGAGLGRLAGGLGGSGLGRLAGPRLGGGGSGASGRVGREERPGAYEGVATGGGVGCGRGRACVGAEGRGFGRTFAHLLGTSVSAGRDFHARLPNRVGYTANGR